MLKKALRLLKYSLPLIWCAVTFIGITMAVSKIAGISLLLSAAATAVIGVVGFFVLRAVIKVVVKAVLTAFANVIVSLFSR